MSVGKNLTGEQIQQTLDLFLYKALEPIILNSDIFDSQVSYILARTSQNRKRKLSSLVREDVISSLCTYLTLTANTDRSERFELIREARLERSFVHIFITRVLKHNEDYIYLYNRYMISPKTERKFMKAELDLMARDIGTDRQGLYRIMTLSKAYLEKFYEYRSTVLSHYLKHCSKQAKMYIEVNSGSNYDFHDARQSILKSVLVAIDKYDSNQGALTSYINWWILNAQTCSTVDHEYGIAYTIPQSHRKKIATQEAADVNYSVSLDTVISDEDEDRNLHSTLSDKVALEQEYETHEDHRIVQYLAKCVDSRGCARLFLDVGEYFSKNELSMMRKHTIDENCK